MAKETNTDTVEEAASKAKTQKEVNIEKKVKLISRLYEDQFVKYYDDEVIIPAQGTVTLNDAGLTEIPTGIMKIEI